MIMMFLENRMQRILNDSLKQNKNLDPPVKNSVWCQEPTNSL